MEPVNGNPTLFRLLKPKENEFVYVRQRGLEFSRGGYTWQGFTMEGNNMYHFCCMGCGHYLRKTLKEKETFDTNHDHEPLDNFNKNRQNNTGCNEFDTPNILIYLLIKLICNSNLSFIQASSNFLIALIKETIVLARLFPNVEPERVFPKLSGAKLSNYVNFVGFNKNFKILEEMQNEQVSILLDAGKSLMPYICSLPFLVLKRR
jgi:hypothetical protein